MADIYAKTGERLVDLGSDQTSLHNPFNGGYYPVQVMPFCIHLALLYKTSSNLLVLIHSDVDVWLF